MRIDRSAIRADEFEGFRLDDEKTPVELDDMVPEWAQPMLCRPDAWANYSDDLVYEVDKRLRKWASTMKWTKRGLDRRYTFREIAEILGLYKEIGKGANYAKIARVFAYYSTRIQRDTTVNGVRKKKVYTLSPARFRNRLPYSLRLRMEEMGDSGTEDPRRLRLPADNLEPGHARNPRTEANMARRSEEIRRRFNEYQRERRERVGRKD